jgi:hypothetical protein
MKVIYLVDNFYLPTLRYVTLTALFIKKTRKCGKLEKGRHVSKFLSVLLCNFVNTANILLIFYGYTKILIK